LFALLGNQQDGRKRYPSDISTKKWCKVVRSLMQQSRDLGGQQCKYELRELLNAMLYKAKIPCCPWGALPGDFPPSNVVSCQYYSWYQERIIGDIDRSLGSNLREIGDSEPVCKEMLAPLEIWRDGRKRYPNDLSDRQWRKVERWFMQQPRGKGGRHRKYELRDLLDAMVYKAEMHCPWRMLPHDYPPWNAVSRHYYPWYQAGVIDEIDRILGTNLRAINDCEPACKVKPRRQRNRQVA
jgi:transposase